MATSEKKVLLGSNLLKESDSPQKPKAAKLSQPLAKKTYSLLKCPYCSAEVKETRMVGHIKKVHSTKKKRLELLQGPILTKELITPKKPKATYQPQPLPLKTYPLIKCKFCCANVKENRMEAHINKVHSPEALQRRAISSKTKLNVEERINLASNHKPLFVKRIVKIGTGEFLYPINAYPSKIEDLKYKKKEISSKHSSPTIESSHSRVIKPRGGIVKCPHGITKPFPCGICNPKGFKQMHGDD